MGNVTNDLRKRSNEELNKNLAALKSQLLEIRFAAVDGETEKVGNVSEIKKTIARILTVLNERRITPEKGTK